MPLLKDITESEMKRARQGEGDSEWNEDRLSDLPDCILLHILSFVKCKDAVRTCILSKRWKDLWKRLPTLTLHSPEFGTLKIFSKFVSRVLSLRDSSVALRTFDFERRGTVEPRILKRVLNYAISHNVQQLGIEVKVGVDQLLRSISSCIFSCQTLTSLKLSVYSENLSDGRIRIVFPQSLNLPALTSLHLVNIAFCASDNDRAEPFSTLNKLNNLVIRQCTLQDLQILCICSNTLSSLTFRALHSYLYKTFLSTPNLHSFVFEGVPRNNLSRSILSFLEQVDIDTDTMHRSSMPPLFLLNWLQGLANVQSLAVTVNTLQVLFLIPDLLKIKLPSLGNLKSLKVKMEPLSWDVTKSLGPANSREENKIQFSPTIPDGILDFLHQNSLSSDVTIIKW